MEVAAFLRCRLDPAGQLCVKQLTAAKRSPQRVGCHESRRSVREGLKERTGPDVTCRAEALEVRAGFDSAIRFRLATDLFDGVLGKIIKFLEAPGELLELFSNWELQKGFGAFMTIASLC